MHLVNVKSFVIGHILVIISLAGFGQHPILQNLNVNNHFSKGLVIDFTILGGNTCNGIRVFHSLDTSKGFNQIGIIPGICGDSEFNTRYDFTHNTPAQFDTNYYYLEFGGSGKSDVFDFFYVGDQTEIKWLINGQNLIVFEPNSIEEFLSVKLVSLNGALLENGVKSEKKWVINKFDYYNKPLLLVFEFKNRKGLFKKLQVIK